MVKNRFSIFVATFLACVLLLGNSVGAFTNSSYYDNQNISIGLESMGSSVLSLTLNGDYTVNGVSFKSGTSYLLKVSGTQIDINGVLYDTIICVPNNSLNTIRMVSSFSRNYFGTLTFKIDSSSGISKVMPINTLNIEDYLKGVVGMEMSDYFPIEALKAQAVAARNYALASISKHKTKGYSLCDTTDCQVYAGYDASLKNVIAAVDATKGMVLLSGTSIVEALYSASDGGYTEASENVWSGARSYFKAKLDDYDMNYPWNRKYSTSSIDAMIKLKPYLNVPINYTFIKIDLGSITMFESGRIKNISLIFKDQNNINYTLSYGKETARTFLSLPSALYDVSYDVTTDTYSFNGNGNGHGVGMSQIGAKNRGTVGQGFEDILKFYYDGTTLVRVLPSITNISVDMGKIYSYDYPSFTVTATGGTTSGLSYEYVIEHNNIILYQSSFSSSSKFQYKPREAGSYNLKVYIKDLSSALPFEDTKTYAFNVDASAQEDVNLDKVVDVYDLVLISKNMDKQRALTENWNERWNVEDVDDIINILDLAKACKNYNYRY